MPKTYSDIFKVTYALGEKCVCTSQNEGENETLVHRGFLSAHHVGLGCSFVAEVDYGGQILLETIRKL